MQNPTVSQMLKIMRKCMQILCCRQESYDLQTLQSVVQYHDKMHGNAKPSSFFHILAHSHPAKTTLKHDAVDEIIDFSIFLMGQNHPETRSSCQMSHFDQCGFLAT